jgi:hypothetical protein
MLSYYEDEFKVQKLNPKGEIELDERSTVELNNDQAPEDKKKKDTKKDGQAHESTAGKVGGHESALSAHCTPYVIHHTILHT